MEARKPLLATFGPVPYTSSELPLRKVLCSSVIAIAARCAGHFMAHLTPRPLATVRSAVVMARYGSMVGRIKTLPHRAQVRSIPEMCRLDFTFVRRVAAWPSIAHCNPMNRAAERWP